MSRLLIVALMVVSSLALGERIATAACSSNGGTHVDSGDSSLGAGVNQGTSCPENEHQPVGNDNWTWHQETLCDGETCAGCPGQPGVSPIHIWATDEDGNVVYDWTGCPDESPTLPELSTSMVANAFKRIPLPQSPLIIQPPDGRTLVNFETNFYTEKERLFRSVTLLGQRIELRIDVHSYTWHFDDGEKLRTSDPGAPFPKLQITHNYLQAGAYRPRLDTTYVADYRVNGGAWQTVPGSVTIEGSPEQLRAVEARPILTG